MKAPNLHLNLLHASERQSSSPVRLRVMLPILAALACAGCLLWWGILKGQLMLVKKDMAAIQKDIDAITPIHADVTNDLNAIRHMQFRLDQLSMYTNACHRYGDVLANVVSSSEEVSTGLKLQEMKLILEPEKQDLSVYDAQRKKKVELPGPTNPVEIVKFEINGRAPDDKPVKECVRELLEKLKGPDFRGTFISVESSTYYDQRQTFKINYRCAERRFEK